MTVKEMFKRVDKTGFISKLKNSYILINNSEADDIFTELSQGKTDSLKALIQFQSIISASKGNATDTAEWLRALTYLTEELPLSMVEPSKPLKTTPSRH